MSLRRCIRIFIPHSRREYGIRRQSSGMSTRGMVRFRSTHSQRCSTRRCFSFSGRKRLRSFSLPHNQMFALKRLSHVATIHPVLKIEFREPLRSSLP